MSAEAVNHSASAETPGPNDIRVMLVDDSLVIRGLISRMVKSAPGMYVVASVGDGARAIEEVKRRDVDVIVLDIEMPTMDGLTALPEIIKARPRVKVIMASTLTGPNADASIRALSLGAADYLAKPTSSADVSGVGGSDVFRRDLIAKIQALGYVARKATGAPTNEALKPASAPVKSTTADKPLLYSGSVALRPAKRWMRRPAVLAVGSSTGGPQALMRFFELLKPTINIPVIVTQHMPPKFTTTLADHISRKTGFPCVEAEDGMALEPNKIALAPGDYHMTIVGTPQAPKVKLNQEPPENFCRPAVDPMLRSLVPVYGERVLTVILTGMGYDGLHGSEEIIKAGGEVIAQDEATSVVWGMPGAVATGGLCSTVLPLDEIPHHVREIITKAMP